MQYSYDLQCLRSYKGNDQHQQSLTTADGSLYRPTQRSTPFLHSVSLVSISHTEGEIAITQPDRASAEVNSAEFRGVFRELR